MIALKHHCSFHLHFQQSGPNAWSYSQSKLKDAFSFRVFCVSKVKAKGYIYIYVYINICVCLSQKGSDFTVPAQQCLKTEWEKETELKRHELQSSALSTPRKKKNLHFISPPDLETTSLFCI